MTNPPNGDPKVQRYRVDQLFEAVERLRTDMSEMFERLDKKLDDRLDSQKRRIANHEERIAANERALARQQIINAVLAAVGGAGLTLAVQLVTG